MANWAPRAPSVDRSSLGTCRGVEGQIVGVWVSSLRGCRVWVQHLIFGFGDKDQGSGFRIENLGEFSGGWMKVKPNTKSL